MIILEGADNLGKTTFCQRFVGDEYVHTSKPSKDFDFNYEAIWNAHFGSTIYDRLFFGAYVYGYVLGLHASPVDLKQLFDNASKFKQMGGVIAVLYASNERWYRSRITAEADREMFDISSIMASNALFQALSLIPDLVDFRHDIYEHGYPGSDLEDKIQRLRTRRNA